MLNEWVHNLYSLQKEYNSFNFLLYNSEFGLPQIWRMVTRDDTQSELVPSICPRQTHHISSGKHLKFKSVTHNSLHITSIAHQHVID